MKDSDASFRRASFEAKENLDNNGNGNNKNGQSFHRTQQSFASVGGQVGRGYLADTPHFDLPISVCKSTLRED